MPLIFNIKVWLIVLILLIDMNKIQSLVIFSMILALCLCQTVDLSQMNTTTSVAPEHNASQAIAPASHNVTQAQQSQTLTSNPKVIESISQPSQTPIPQVSDPSISSTPTQTIQPSQPAPIPQEQNPPSTPQIPTQTIQPSQPEPIPQVSDPSIPQIPTETIQKSQDSPSTPQIPTQTIQPSQPTSIPQVSDPSTPPIPTETLSEYNDPNFIKLIDNYFGCKNWTDGSCVQCSKGYIFNNEGICCVVDQHCQQFNRDVGICEQCYTGYSVTSNGSCQATSTDSTNVGCAEWKNKVCNKCSVRYYFNSDQICTPVSDHCRDWNEKGECTSCYGGYQVSDISCVPSQDQPLSQNVKENPLCATWTDSKCVACATRSWVNAQGICESVSDHCDTWDKLDGLCLSCYAGYDLQNGACVYSPSNTALPSDGGCKQWKNGACVECSNNWVFNSLGSCIPVSDQCKTFDTKGECLSCYVGYDITNGSCLFSDSNNAQPSDGGCKTWDWGNLKCLECSHNWVFNSNGFCIPVSDECRTFDSAGLCTGCFKGYDVNNGSCVFSDSNSAPLPDAGCKIWNWEKNACQVCSDHWYSSNGVCAQVSSLCNSFDASTGLCLACYLGYDLVNGTCVYSASNNAAPADSGCASWSNGVCKECSKNYAFNSNGVCTQVSDHCKTSEGLACTSCYNGYSLVNGSCIFSPLNSAIPSDAGCSTWDWNNQVCLKCSPYWYFNSNKVCVPVSDLCKTYDSESGLCLSCYKGYDLSSGNCVLSDKNSKPVDQGCANWDWDNQICLKCSQFWVSINNTCQSVSPYCKTHGEGSTLCTSCFLGYSLKNGVCQAVQTNCKSQDSNGACLTCFNGFALYKGQCVSLGSLSDIALYYAACCPQKLAQLQAEGRIPK